VNLHSVKAGSHVLQRQTTGYSLHQNSTIWALCCPTFTDTSLLL